MTVSREHAPAILSALAVVALLVAGGLLAPGFGTPANIVVVIGLTSFIGIVALGQGAVMLTGGIDLSVPWTFTLGAVLFSQVAAGADGGVPAALAAVCAAALVIGVVHATLIERLRVSPIVVTLATAGILQGIALWMTNGTPSGAPPRLVLDMAQGSLAGIPIRVVVWGILAVALAGVMLRTMFGRHVFAVGENRLAADIAGVPSFMTLAGAYCLSAFLSAIAGVLFAGFSGMSYLGMGDEFLLPSIAACVLGGISIYGGRGTVSGLVMGALFISVLATVLTVMNVGSGVKLAATGVVILLAVAALAGSNREEE